MKGVMGLGRDYDKELAAAQAKVERIKAAKSAAERRRYEPVGRAMYTVFAKELSGLKGKAQLEAFCRSLRDAWDASGASEPPVAPVSPPGGTLAAQGRENVSESLTAAPGDMEP